MPVQGPPSVQIDDDRVEEVFCFVMGYLGEAYRIQKLPLLSTEIKLETLRQERNNNLKEAIRKLFELDSWESW